MSQKRQDHLIQKDNETGICTILLKKEYFEQVAVMKTLRLFLAKVYCEMLPEGEDYVKIKFLRSLKDDVILEKIPYEFYNAVIDQQIREDLVKSSIEIQKAIYNSAFSPIANKAGCQRKLLN